MAAPKSWSASPGEMDLNLFAVQIKKVVHGLLLSLAATAFGWYVGGIRLRPIPSKYLLF
jgi:hypothetical protein